MSLRKHGVGEVLPEEGEDLTKTAKQDWSEEDEKDLDQETKEK